MTSRRHDLAPSSSPSIGRVRYNREPGDKQWARIGVLLAIPAAQHIFRGSNITSAKSSALSKEPLASPWKLVALLSCPRPSHAQPCLLLASSNLPLHGTSSDDGRGIVTRGGRDPSILAPDRQSDSRCKRSDSVHPRRPVLFFPASPLPAPGLPPPLCYVLPWFLFFRLHHPTFRCTFLSHNHGIKFPVVGFGLK